MPIRRPPLAHLEVALLATLVVATALFAPSPASARRGPCLAGTSGGPSCAVWTGRATFVGDGDTLDVDIRGDGTARPARVRITGVQAMEQSVYSSDPRRRRGACHALAATARLEGLVRRASRVVRLAARDPRSRSEGRLRRSVAVRIGGRWIDVAGVLVAEGHALWLPNPVEWAWNRRLGVLAERAALAGRRLHDPDACGAGPSSGADLRVVVNWDADLNDFENVNGEWVRVENHGDRDVPLRGWWLRDSFLRRFSFPSWAVVPARGAVTMFVGAGIDAGRSFFWRQPAPAFENATGDARAMGDGAYLFDPHGDLRASMTYPCRVRCRDPRQGSLQVRAEPRGDEEVVIRNTGAVPVGLDGLRLESAPYGHAFRQGDVLRPGEVMRVVVGGDPADDTPLVRHWPVAGPILDNPGDVVRVATYRGVVVACDAWGAGRCS